MIGLSVHFGHKESVLKKSLFSDEQIVRIFQEAASGQKSQAQL